MSNLLEKASIIHVPAGYDVGSINAVKPKYEISSTEVIANNDFTDGGNNWTIQNDVTFSNDTAIIDATSGNAYINQNALTVGFKYKVSITVDSLSISSKCDLINASGTIYQNLSVGVNEFEIEANQTAFRIRVKDNAIGVISNTSVRKINEADFAFDRGTGGSVQSRVKGNQTIVFPNIETPRIDYTGGTGHWLIEPQATNYATYSNDLTQSIYTKDNGGVGVLPIVTANYSISPDGTQNASRLQCDLNGGNTSSDYSYIYNIGAVQNNNGNVSVYLKNNESGSKVVYFRNTFGTIDNVTVTESWQRFNISNADTRGLYLGLRGSYGNSDTCDISVYGIQIEDNTFATSLIPTSGGTETRDTETAINSGHDGLFGQTEGVLYAEIAALDTSSLQRIIQLSDSSSSTTITISFNSDGNLVLSAILNNTVAVNSTSTPYNAGQFYKIAIKYESGNSAIWIDGVENVPSSTTYNPIDTINKFGLEAHYAGADFYGKVKCLAVFKEALTDSELQCLTS